MNNSIPLDPYAPDDPGDRAKQHRCSVCGEMYEPSDIAYYNADLTYDGYPNAQCGECDRRYVDHFEPNMNDWLGLRQ